MKEYGYPGGGEQFVQDIAQKAEKALSLYREFVGWMIEHAVDTEMVRMLFACFYTDFVTTERNELMRPKYRCKAAKAGKVGETSSKYGYPGGGEQFVQDVAQKAEEAEALFSEFVEWMKERNVEPDTVRMMFVRFYYEYCDIGRMNENA